MASYLLELGAATPLFFALRDRERILDLIESVTGGRFHSQLQPHRRDQTGIRAGPNTKKDIPDPPKGFFDETRRAIDKRAVELR